MAKFAKQASVTRFVGKGFETCDTPSLAAMTAWGASPYRAIGVYVGGPNRYCHQANLNAAWVSTVSAAGWKLLPTYMGLQAPCSDHTTSVRMSAATAAAQGKASADDAVKSLTALGIQPGSPIYDDLENYDPTNAGCGKAVLSYLSGFTQEVHAKGYLFGVYINLTPGSAALAGAYSSKSYARPDVLWLARWDENASVSAGFTTVTSKQWSVHQRVKQYHTDDIGVGTNPPTKETYGGVTMDVDDDYIDAPVATIDTPLAMSAKATAYAGPTKSAKSAGSLAKGAAVQVVCQAPGTSVGGTTVWDKLSTGSYVSNAYVGNKHTGYTAGVARCGYAYQVKPAKGTAERTGAGSTYKSKGTRWTGDLAWVVCQKSASKKTGRTKVWDKLDNGTYVTDNDIATASSTTYSAPIPRC